MPSRSSVACSRLRRWAGLAMLLWGVLPGSGPAHAAESILLQSTTSTQASGLFDHLLPRFTAEHGIEVRVVAVGTGQALKNAADGNGDVVLVHDEAAEAAFIAAGHGRQRHAVMVNEFVIVGPAADPAGVGEAPDAVTAFARIAAAGALFLSRGDESGTHTRERSLWAAAGVAVAPSLAWYRDVGSGMGRTLAMAAELDGYTLCDRASWLTSRARGGLALLFEGDARLVNPYSLIVVDPARHPHVKAAAAQRFVDWMTGPTGQAAIAAFTRDGQPLFRPSAR